MSRDIEIMLGRGVPVYMRILWCIVTPLLLLVRQFIHSLQNCYINLKYHLTKFNHLNGSLE